MTDSLDTVNADTIDTVTIYYYDEAEKNLISRSIYDSAVSPNPDKISEYVCRVVPLKVTLLRVKKHVRAFGGSSSIATVFKLVVMDGSNAVFLCTANTAISSKLSDMELVPGSTLVINSYKWVNLEAPLITKGTMARSFCFLDKMFEVKPAPFAISHSGDDDSSAVTLEYETLHIDYSVLECVLESAYLVFTHPVHHTKDGDFIYGLMDTEDIQAGRFIPNKKNHQLFVEAIFPVKYAKNATRVYLMMIIHLPITMVITSPLAIVARMV